MSKLTCNLSLVKKRAVQHSSQFCMLCLKNYFTQQKNKAAIQRPRPLSQRMSLLVARKQSCKGLTLSKRDFLILLSYSLTYCPVKTTVHATHSRRHLVLESSGEILTLRMPTIRKRTTSDARSHKHHHYNGLVSFTPRQYSYTPKAHEKTWLVRANDVKRMKSLPSSRVKETMRSGRFHYFSCLLKKGKSLGFWQDIGFFIGVYVSSSRFHIENYSIIILRDIVI